MHVDQAIYRQLYSTLMDARGKNAYGEIVIPWLLQAGIEREQQWLKAFSTKPDQPYPSVAVEELWRLYALSRVNDFMLMSFQPSPQAKPIDYEGGAYKLGFGLDQYLYVMTFLGLQIVDRSAFHPFFHEIVSVEVASDEDHPIEITGIRWPCLMLNSMMFSRAGVSVRGGRNHVRKEIAEFSTLYWAYWRRYKPTNDLSHGWGSNSQWRTSFRRDYETENEYFYNVDCKAGVVDLTRPDLEFKKPTQPLTPASPRAEHIAHQMNGVTREQRIEFIKNRCFIKTESGLDSDRYDLWPYDDFYHESKA